MSGLFRIGAMAGIVAVAVSAAVGSAAPAQAAWSPARVYHQPPWVLRQGEPVTLAYGFVDRGVAVYVRNDRSQRYVRVPLTRSTDGSGLWLARVAGSLVRGSTLSYYAVLRDPASSRSVTIPAGGAGHPQRVWIVRRLVPAALDAHRVGRLTAPESIVAHAPPHEVGFACCADPPGGDGPQSFDVARDGSVWVLDKLNRRLLVWSAGRTSRPARTIPLLPRTLGLRDFALGHDGTIYLYATDGRLYAVAPSGAVRWSEPIAGKGPLHLGPGGVLFAPHVCGGACAPFGGNDAPAFAPVTTTGGAPLRLADQILRTRSLEPLARGLRLAIWAPSRWSARGSDLEPTKEVRVALIGRRDRIVRAWRVTSVTRPTLDRMAPALIGGDLVVAFDVTREARGVFSPERIVLRLGASGASRRLSLAAASVFGEENLDSTPLRVGSDGRLYQLRTDRTRGVTVVRYPLGAPVDRR